MSPQREGGRRDSARSGAPKGGANAGRKGGPSRQQSGKSAERSGQKWADKPGRSSDRQGKRPYSRRRDAEPRELTPRTAEQQRYDGPEIPEEITGKELDRSVQAALRSLPEKLALRVARHLAAAGAVIDEDPKTAYEHTLAAFARANRLAVVREAVGEAAYAAGEYSEALAQLRAAKRMNGSWDYLAIMADCERALGKPDRALTMLRSAPRESLSQDLNVELTIVEAGARNDRGEFDAALRALEAAPLTTKSRAAWAVRLRYAYADALLAAGRREDALTWFHRAAAIDGDAITDAVDRIAELEG